MNVDYDTRYEAYKARGMHPAVAAVQAHYDVEHHMCACDYQPKKEVPNE